MEVNVIGTKIYRNSRGKPHRKDGPAVEYEDGTQFYCKNGKYHREDGPAVEYPNGSKGWYINGQLHRLDGPAIEYADGSKYWRINGEDYSFEDWLEKLQISDEEKIMLCLKWK